MFLKPFSQYRDAGALILRVGLAVPFLIHGMQKWQYWTAMPPGTTPTMGFIFKALSIIEPLAALAMAAGLCTVLAALVLGIIMIGAIYTKITLWKMGYSAGWELDFSLLSICVYWLCSYPGQYSVDAMQTK